MSIPKQVQQAAEQVAAIEQALAAETAPPPQPNPADHFDLTPVPAPEPPPPAPPAPAPAPTPPAPPPENWEHKYKTLQGLFNNTVPKLQEQLRQAGERLSALEKAKPPAEPPKKPAADPKDVQEFGADMVAMVERVAERLFGAVAHDLTARLAQLETQLNTTGQAVAQTAEQAFMAEVERRVPDWREINKDERFLAWLKEIDPLFGEERQAALDKASQTLNPALAANVFRQWQASVAPPPAAPAPAPKPSVEPQVAPPARASTPPPVSQPVGPLVTQRQIEVFYNELAQGKYRGREAEAQRIEAHIQQALVEGRVR